MFRKKLQVDMKFLHVKANMGFFSEHDVGKKSHVDMRFSHVNMGFFSQHRVGKKSHVNMEHLFLMIKHLENCVTQDSSERSLASSRCTRQMHSPRHPEGAYAKCDVLQPRTDEV